MATLVGYSNDGYLATVAIPNYSNYITIYNSTSDCSLTTYTAAEDGFLLVKINTQGTSGYCFYRIYINNGLAIEQNGKENNNYVFCTTAPIPVRKGDEVKYTLASGESVGKKQLYLLRKR